VFVVLIPVGRLRVCAEPDACVTLAWKELYKSWPSWKEFICIFTHDWSKLNQIKLHLKGTDFQLKVWEILLKVPIGQLETYGHIAERIQNPKASRAVGSAIGDNPVAFLIPCHRVIQANGAFGQYHWGATRKAAMIGWEAVKTDKMRV